jgi:hypothetical protein
MGKDRPSAMPQKVLLDNCTPAPVGRFLTDCPVVTAARLGWEKLKNGLLLSQAEQDGFTVLVTCDQSMQHQENLSGRTIALVVLETNDLSLLRLYREEIAHLVRDAKPGGYYTLPIDYRRK